MKNYVSSGAKGVKGRRKTTRDEWKAARAEGIELVKAGTCDAVAAVKLLTDKHGLQGDEMGTLRRALRKFEDEPAPGEAYAGPLTFLRMPFSEYPKKFSEKVNG